MIIYTVSLLWQESVIYYLYSYNIHCFLALARVCDCGHVLLIASPGESIGSRTQVVMAASNK